MRIPILVYISGHGFGHLAQVAPVLERLAARRPGVELHLRTGIPDAMLRHFLGAPFVRHPGAVDVGAVQRDALTEDMPATRAAIRDFFGDWEGRLRAETTLIRELRPALVFSDISPLAFPAARAAGVPCAGLCCLDWHEIYTPWLAPDDPALSLLAGAHADCELLLRPPLSLPMRTFPRRREIGLIARRPRLDRAEARRRLGLDDDVRVALAMFGGTTVPLIDFDALGRLAPWRFLVPVPVSRAPENIVAAPEWSTVDLLSAADLLVTKAGYGAIAEAWRAERPLVYVPRPNFAEYAVQEPWLARAPAAPISPEDLRAGRWRGAMEVVLGSERRYPPTGGDGADEAAAILAGMV